MSQIIVVGGGLAGLSAAHTIYENGGSVLVLDKNPFFGGNSTKATSGINGTPTRTQIEKGIPDSAKAFYDDTARSARDLVRPELVKVLTYNSGSAVEWLMDKFGLDLSLVSQLGGHSFPRTHRGKERFPGMTITYALMEKLEDLAQSDPSRVRTLAKANVKTLIRDASGNVIGVEYEKDGKLSQEYGPVILATGGYAADFTEDSLIKKYRPELYDLPTTNGDHSTGDGIKMAIKIGARTTDLEKIQVHPTGLVDLKEPQAKVKFLAAEALRGVGGLLLNGEGKRFCDELGHRDYVTGEIWKTKGPVRLVLNSAANREIEWHIKHYMGRGLMFKFENGAALAKEIGVSPKTLEETFQAYNEAAKAKKDQYGKKFYHNVPFFIEDTFYVAYMTPVLHYTMGGLEISPEAEIKGQGNVIPGLFGAGEICGGVHGANRLGGSSLLGCVVYGRVAGSSASRYLLKNLSKTPAGAAGRVGQLAGHLQGFNVNVDPSQNRIEISWGGSAPVTAAPVAPVQTAAPASAPSTPAAAPAPAPVAVKEYTKEEVAKHNTEKDCWVILGDLVLDCTSFLKDHPGGKKAILLYAGKDATEEFLMLHKPSVIEKYAPNTVIGKFKGGKPLSEHQLGN